MIIIRHLNCNRIRLYNKSNKYSRKHDSLCWSITSLTVKLLIYIFVITSSRCCVSVVTQVIDIFNSLPDW